MTNKEQPIVNKWVEGEIALPTELKDLANTVSTILTPIISTLELSNALAQQLKDVAPVFPDNPALAFINGLVENIFNYIDDLRNLGFYLAGDFNLLSWPFKELEGGFNRYERRMISRLMDNRDETRPQFTEESQVVALFCYASAPDLDFLAEPLVNLIKFAKLLSVATQNANYLPTPTSVKVLYSNSNIGFQDIISVIKSGKLPEKIEISWSASSVAFSGNPLSKAGAQIPAPDGFLIEISTLKDGLPIFYEQPKKDQPPNQIGKTVTEKGQLKNPDGKPLSIFGGIKQLDVPNAFDYLATQDSQGFLNPEKRRIFAKINNVNIPLSLIDDSILQKTFYVDSKDLLIRKLMTPKEDVFRVEIPLKDLPRQATFERDGISAKKKIGDISGTYYVKIRAVGSAIQNPNDFRYTIQETDFLKAGIVQANYKETSENITPSEKVDFGVPSTATSFVIPHRNTSLFLESLTCALVVLLLSRSDLPVITNLMANKNLPSELVALSGLVEDALADEMLQGKSNTVLQDVAAKETGLEGFSEIRKNLFEGIFVRDLFKQERLSQVSFRQAIFNACQKVASNLYQKMNPSASVEKSFVEKSALLRSWKWKDSKNVEIGNFRSLFPNTTILESMQSFETNSGVAANPFSIGLPEDKEIDVFYSSAMGSRKDGFLQTAPQSKHESLPSEVDENQKKEILAKKPHLETLFDQIPHTTKNGKKSYQVPELFSSPKETYVLGSADYSPVFYVDFPALASNKGGKIFYCRNLIDDEIYQQAATVLQIASASKTRPENDGAWKNIQLLEAIPDFKELIKVLEAGLLSLKKGLQGGRDTIENYVNFLDKRIKEMKEYLKRIKTLIKAPFDFAITNNITILPVVANGTQDLINRFLQAQGKPKSSQSEYTFGFVFVAGGLPAFAVSFLMALAKEKEKDSNP